MQPSTTEQANALRGIRRLCHAGLDSQNLRYELGCRLTGVFSADAFTFATTDPDTGMMNHAVSEGVPESVFDSWLDHLYPYRIAAEVLEMSTVGPSVTTACSGMVREVLEPVGLGHDLRGVLGHSGEPIGFICFLRDRSAPEFSEDHVAILEEVSPHLVHGLTVAALLDRAEPFEGAGEVTEQLPSGPGVLVMGLQGSMLRRNAAGRVYAEDLRDLGHGIDHIPSSIASVAGRLAAAHRVSGYDPRGLLDSSIVVQGRSGHWYSIRASLTEPDLEGKSEIIVLIDRAAGTEVAPILTRLYGLTSREREVLAWAAKGASTKRIAAALGISRYTVQEHIGNACTKAGVRTRTELLATLFLDGYASSLREGASAASTQ